MWRLDGSSSGSPIPTRLVERPKVRHVWLCGFAALGVLLIVVGMLSPGSSGERWMPFLWFGLGAVLLAVGTVALRWSIVADQDGIRHLVPPDDPDPP